MTIRVLIVDDSPAVRALLTARLASESDIKIVACASCAKEARLLMKQHKPDVVTLDIEMPGMDGLSFLQKIMSLRPTPVIIVSGSTQEGNDATVRALSLGAVSCYAKADRAGGLAGDDRGKLAKLIREAAVVTFDPDWRISLDVRDRIGRDVFRQPDVIAIGASTGGVEAIRAIIPRFGADCPPTLIVQHVNARFAGAIARSLNDSCEAKVSLADSGMRLRRGHVYFAPGGDRHLAVCQPGEKELTTILRPGGLVSSHRPSIDVLFHSIAKCRAQNAIGVLLTGMGQDGAQGLLAMQQAGARTIAQDESTCVVFGMPRVAIALGAAEIVAPIGKIADHMLGRKAA